jgi:hypothetical protein
MLYAGFVYCCLAFRRGGRLLLRCGRRRRLDELGYVQIDPRAPQSIVEITPHCAILVTKLASVGLALE